MRIPEPSWCEKKGNPLTKMLYNYVIGSESNTFCNIRFLCITFSVISEHHDAKEFHLKTKTNNTIHTYTYTHTNMRVRARSMNSMFHTRDFY